MPTRVGIEISPVACRIVELEAEPRWRRQTADTRVRSFARLPLTGPQMRGELASLRGRKVAVVAWGLRSDHRQVIVTNGSKDRMRREAMAAVRNLGVDTRGMMGDVAPVTPQVAGMTRRPVVLAIAAAHEVSSAVEPLVDAGLNVRSVVTPAVALMSLARLRRAFAAPDVMEAYVALEENMMSFALVRDGALIAARDFAWGYVDEPLAQQQPRPREEIATRLADELESFFGAVAAGRRSVTQVCICGGLPELRSMTVPLMERLDLEVETLDSLFAIDAARLPEPTDEFRERCAELRLAWAVVADWPEPINLLRERQRRQTRTALARAAVIAGVTAGLGVGWKVERSAWWQSTASKSAAGVKPPTSPSTRQAAPAKSAPVRQAPPSTAMTNVRPLLPPAPPVVNAPVVKPPAVKPPVVKPLIVNAPVVEPPIAKAPAVKPPVVKPLIVKPLIVNAPVVEPPIAKAPAVKPPVVEPLIVNAPVVEPLIVNAPVVKPPIAKAPVVTPPIAKAPVVKPPVVSAPSSAVAKATPPAGNKPAAPPVARAEPSSAVAKASPPVANATPPVAQTAAPPKLATATPTRAPATPTLAPGAPSRREETPRPEATAPREPQPKIGPAPLPFDAALSTILYSPDRKLAIIDGRIVQPGDDVRGARVIEITSMAVLLRDAQGRLRRLALDASGR